MNWIGYKLRILSFKIFLFTSWQPVASQIQVEHDSALVKLQETGFELVFSHETYDFFEFSLHYNDILVLQRTPDAGVAQILLLNDNHLPKDTLRLNCWPEYYSNSHPLLWSENNFFHFKPQMIYRTAGVCDLDSRKQKADINVKFKLGNRGFEEFACEVIEASSYKKLKSWDTHESFYSFGTEIIGLTKKKKSIYLEELHIGPHVLNRNFDNKPSSWYYIRPLADRVGVAVFDSQKAEIFFSKNNQILDTLRLSSSEGMVRLNRIIFDSITKKLYGVGIWDELNKSTAIFEVNQDSGKLSLYDTIRYPCADIEITDGQLYFIIYMKDIHPSLDMFGLFKKDKP